MSAYPADNRRPIGTGLPEPKDEEKWGPIPAKWGKAILGVAALALGVFAVLKVTDKDEDVEHAAKGAYKDAKHKAKDAKKDIKDAFK